MGKFFLGLGIGFVVGVLGTLACIVLAAFFLPSLVNSRHAARESSTSSTLQTIRSQIELFKIQHNDTPPDPAGMWNIMTGRSNPPDVRRPNPTGVLGPYMQIPPVNPTNGQSAVGPSPSPSVGWVYHVSGSNYTVDAVNEKRDGVLPY